MVNGGIDRQVNILVAVNTPERDHIFRARARSDLTTATAASMRVGRVTLAHAVVSLFTRPPAGEATGVAMGPVDRGLLWFDADRTPASGIPGRSGPTSPGAPRGGEPLRRSRRGARKAPARGADAMDDRTRGDPRDPLGPGSARAVQGHRPGIADEPRDPAHRGATT
jgi:hypothetical protein